MKSDETQFGKKRFGGCANIETANTEGRQLSTQGKEQEHQGPKDQPDLIELDAIYPNQQIPQSGQRIALFYTTSKQTSGYTSYKRPIDPQPCSRRNPLEHLVFPSQCGARSILIIYLAGGSLACTVCLNLENRMSQSFKRNL